MDHEVYWIPKPIGLSEGQYQSVEHTSKSGYRVRG